MTMVMFKTAIKMPAGFDAWTFFWQMLKIDPDASLTYVVIQLDGEECHVADKPIKMAVGKNKGSGLFRQGEGFRSNFRKGVAGGDPSVFYAALN